MKLLFAFLVILFGSYHSFIFPGGMRESDIADPEKQSILPDELIGDFIIPELYTNTTVSIYPSNKYIITIKSDDHTGYEYGHITANNGSYFFLPLNRFISYTTSLTRIYFDDPDLYFYNNDRKINLLRKRPKVIDSDAERINIVMKEESRYFKLRDDNSLEVESKILRPYSNYSLSLRIAEGAVTIAVIFRDGRVYWEGYLEIIEENETETKGKIIFTEGAAFREVENGIGSITINERGAKAILPCIGCFPNRGDYDCGDPLDMVVMFVPVN
jgi:hypothetical protein